VLRIRFDSSDLARTRIATQPDPFWEIALSLHRFQSRHGWRTYRDWHRSTVARLNDSGHARAVRSLLLPLLPRAAYFPDFLTPAESELGLDAGIEAILATPHERVRRELAKLDRVHGIPAWLHRVGERGERVALAGVLRAYHATAIKPVEELIQGRIEADRVLRTRALLEGGIDGLLHSFRPRLRWKPPVLEADYAGDLDIDLGGRGLRLIPSYFCWGSPVALADPQLAPVLVYPVDHGVPGTGTRASGPGADQTPLARLLGPTRAAVLNAVAAGSTTGELARLVGVSPATASHHVAVLRDSGLLGSHRTAGRTLHVLTPAGRSLLRAAAEDAPPHQR
jgi:DNA-binding transcriptional ArsR family regulator